MLCGMLRELFSLSALCPFKRITTGVSQRGTSATERTKTTWAKLALGLSGEWLRFIDRMLNTQRHCVCSEWTSQQTNDQQTLIICYQGLLERAFPTGKHARTPVSLYTPSGMCPSDVA